MRELEFPIVLTSGNASEEPQCIDNEQALERLTDITDYFVLHNRDIVNRIDDSVVREIDAGIQFYRRARGYAPSPITLADDLASKRNILALGGELKNTFALLQDNRATLSQHMGNLENLQTYDDYLKNLELYQRLFQFRPEVVAIDAHPEYLSSKLGRQMANELDLPLIEIQHHHAHIAACLADNGWHKSQGKVLGIALDGLGYGSDGSIWGGEFLLADYTNSERLGRFKPVALPGGIRALLEPWRNTFAHLYEVGNFEDLLQRHTALDLMQELSVKPWKTLERMIETETNAPLSSSCGRLFDAVAAALGLCRDHISYEGQAAIELEALINTRSLEQALPYPFEIQQKELLQINPVPMWQALLHDLHRHRNAAHIASRFHVTLAHMIAVMADKLRHLTGIGTIALSGGVFQNSTLLRLVHGQLVQRDFQLLRHKQVPANDGGLALGQAAIAAAQLQTGEN
jgi:hydrogenase maturation protein HypF